MSTAILNRKDASHLAPLYDSSSPNTNGVYACRPAATPKYQSLMGRDILDNLTVARMYLSGGNYNSLNNAAQNFEYASYVGLFLQEVTERNTEKSQIIPMNGDGYAAFFSGKEPSIYSFGGVLLNTQQDQWRSILAHLYEEVFRGSKVAGMNRMVQISYDDKVVTGSMMNLTQVLAGSPDETFSKFSFDILVASVYDAWATDYSDASVTSNAFLGDKTIFPDVSNKTDKKGLQDFVRTAYLAPPPKREAGKGGPRCTIEHITRNIAGERVLAADSKLDLSKVNGNCYTADAVQKAKAAAEREEALRIQGKSTPEKVAKLVAYARAVNKAHIQSAKTVKEAESLVSEVEQDSSFIPEDYESTEEMSKAKANADLDASGSKKATVEKSGYSRLYIAPK